MKLCNCIRVFRRKYALTQSQLASLVGVSKNSISSLERGDFGPTLVTALKLARVFNTTVDNIFWIDSDRSSSHV